MANRIIVYAKGRADGGAHPAGTKLGKLRPGPPGIVLPAPVTAGTPVVVVREKELRNELGPGGEPMEATSPSRVMIYSFFGVGFTVTRSGRARTAASITGAVTTPGPGGCGRTDGTKEDTVRAPCVFLYALSLL